MLSGTSQTRLKNKSSFSQSFIGPQRAYREAGGAPALSKEIAMTMLNNTSSYAVTAPGVRKGAAILLARLGNLINRWIAAVIAHRERRAALVALRLLSDRDLKDIGLCRNEIGDALAERAEERARMQNSQRF
jgi:uncharacterized protein YjiS (DUF1127 family)